MIGLAVSMKVLTEDRKKSNSVPYFKMWNHSERKRKLMRQTAVSQSK